MTGAEAFRLAIIDLHKEGRRLLDEAEHAREVGTAEVQFAATMGAATIQRAINIVTKWERQL